MKNQLLLLFKSFKFAFNGLKLCFLSQRNFRIHIVFTFTVFLLSFLYYNFTKLEYIILFLICNIVLICEIINTCIEKIMDYVDLERNEKIKFIKDVSAASVLVCSITSFFIGSLLFFDIHVLNNIINSIFFNLKNLIILIFYSILSFFVIFFIKEEE